MFLLPKNKYPRGNSQKMQDKVAKINLKIKKFGKIFLRKCLALLPNKGISTEKNKNPALGGVNSPLFCKGFKIR